MARPGEVPEPNRTDAAASAAGAALPLVLWVVVLIGASGATLSERLPFWAFALLVTSPVLLLAAVLSLRAPHGGSPETIETFFPLS